MLFLFTMLGPLAALFEPLRARTTWNRKPCHGSVTIFHSASIKYITDKSLGQTVSLSEEALRMLAFLLKVREITQEEKISLLNNIGKIPPSVHFLDIYAQTMRGQQCLKINKSWYSTKRKYKILFKITKQKLILSFSQKRFGGMEIKSFDQLTHEYFYACKHSKLANENSRPLSTTTLCEHRE